VVGFSSPATIFWKLSSEAVIVASTPSSAPSATAIVPSATRTVHVPAPSMSKT
jgi:hypothetical protein